MSSKKRKVASKFAIGDVVTVQVNRNDKELCRVRWVGKTGLSKTQMYGVEYFKYRIGVHEVHGVKVLDGRIGTTDKPPLFKTNKKQYGTFIDSVILDRSAQLKWNKKISDKYMKIKKFDKSKFIDAAKFGSAKVVRHLLQQKGYKQSKVIPGFQWAIAYNHPFVIQTIFEHHFGVEHIEDIQDEKKMDDDANKCMFFDQDSLSKIIINKNKKILDLVLKFDQWPLMKDENTLSNKAIYSLFSSKGNISFIKYFIDKIIEYKDKRIVYEYLNYPLMKNTMNINSTITHAVIKGNKWNYLQYLLTQNPAKEYIKLQPDNNCLPAPLLLCLVMNIKTPKSLGNLRKFAKIMLDMNANINWFPDIPLRRQLQIQKATHIQSFIDATFSKHHEIISNSHLFYYDIGKKYKKTQAKLANRNHFIAGSILSAFIYQLHLILDPQNINVKNIDNVENDTRNIIALFLEYGAILYHNVMDSNYSDFMDWDSFNNHIESYPKNMYIYNNRNNKMKVYYLPQNIRSELIESYSIDSKMVMYLKDMFSFSIIEHKKRLKILLETVDIHDGLRFVFAELLPDYLCWDLEYVDQIAATPPSRQITPRRRYTSSSDFYYSSSW